MKELSCVLDFWKIQWKAIRTCLSCRETCDTSYRNKKAYESPPPTVRPSAVIIAESDIHDKNEEYKALLSTYDIV